MYGEAERWRVCDEDSQTSEVIGEYMCNRWRGVIGGKMVGGVICGDVIQVERYNS